ncbi:MAG: Phenylalanyl-tRNA synthetase beta chain [Firmicutes bacterium]|nr:Phenylalanyl-tRNA synthetase beta chain [Bacillota bacterium]MDI6706492.1 phenylalanine--tRNA ligase subunit beta [Bacillota bacterium]
MLVPVNWLKDYVDIDMDVKTLADTLTMSGTKVELILDASQEISNVVVGKVIEMKPHPNADRLLIAMVDVGDRVLQIITGAQNVKAGHYVPIALDGAVLPGGMEIKTSKMRGEESQGMMCSALELAMDLNSLSEDKKEGIYILDGEHAPGTDITKVLNLEEKVIEFEITTNRPDCLSIIGIAREAGAVLKVPYRKPVIEIRKTKGNINDYVKGITIEEPELCYRYVARVIDNIKIEPSPQWMQKRLIQAGMRPINNIVDITNYVMLETGQPLHAFDLDKVGGREIIVRRAKDREEMVTLDGKKRILGAEDLVIADEQVPVGIAGAMGGEFSEITRGTRTVLLESASFNGYNVRMTCKRLGLWSEASFRFVRGVYPGLAETAANRAVMLMEQLGAGEVVEGVIDIYPEPVKTKHVEVSSDRINRLIGIDITAEEMKDMLERLEMAVKADNGMLSITVPAFRQDIEVDYDIAEEIARLYGYNNVPKTIMEGSWVQGKKTLKEKLEDQIKDVLCGLGLYEIQTYSFESPGVFDKLRLPEEHHLRRTVEIKNPLGEEYSIMRTTLLSSMLNVLSINYNRGIKGAGLYEIAPRFIPREIPLKQLPDEKLTISLGIYGDEDFYSLKGRVEVLLDELKIRDYSFRRAQHPSYHPGRTAEVVIGEEVAGIIGEAHPDVAKAYQIDTRVYMGEIDFSLLMEASQSEIKYSPLPKYPAITRDIAVLVDKETEVGRIAEAIEETGGELVEKLELFDVYTGKQIPDGKKSVAYSITLRSKERTLVDEDANRIVKDILDSLMDLFGAKLR